LLYVLDGILIGAGDTRFLAWTMLVALLTFLPLAGIVLVTDAGLIALWWALAVWLLVRQVAVALRYRSGAWLRTGPGRRR
jgi:Na+-driven multidrug efflux pump